METLLEGVHRHTRHTPWRRLCPEFVFSLIKTGVVSLLQPLHGMETSVYNILSASNSINNQLEIIVVILVTPQPVLLSYFCIGCSRQFDLTNIRLQALSTYQ